MSMVKLIVPGSQPVRDSAPQVVKVASRGLRGSDLDEFVKRAGHQFVDALRQVEFHPGEVPVHLIAMGSTEAYNCFVAGTPVRTGSGSLVPIETIKVGDRVVDRLGRSAPVTTVYTKHYQGRGIKFRASGMLDPVVSTENHKFWVIRREQVACLIDSAKHCKPDTCQKSAICRERNCSRSTVRYEPEWVEAKDLRPGDYVTVPVPDRGVGSQSWKWSVPLARVIGYFLSEGCFIKEAGQKTGMSLSFNRNEADTLAADVKRQVELLQENYADVYVNGPYFSEDHNTCVLHVMSRSLATRVGRAVGEYSTKKTFSGEVYSQTPAVLAHMLATYLDGDGTCPVYERTDCAGTEARYTMGTGSRQLALDLQWILGRFGVAASVCLAYPAGEYDILGVKCQRSDFFHVSFSNKNGLFLKDICGKHTDRPPLQNKQWSFEWNGMVCRPIRSVEFVELDEQVFNIEVEGDHTYTVGNGIAVKNCNRNGDGFKEASLRKYHPTFKKFAFFYRDHDNRNPEKSYGVVKLSSFNERMKRVELICALNGTKEAADRNKGLLADRELEKLANDQNNFGVSMACKVPNDVCSGCQNVARTRDEYCLGLHEGGSCKYGGLKHNITKVAADGHVLHADNPDPTFFDISHVYRPADRIAWVLGQVKAASAVKMSGAQMAERAGVEVPFPVMAAGLDPRAAALAKTAYALAAAEASLAGRSSPADLSFHPDVAPPAEAPGFAKYSSAKTQMWSALADRQVLLPLKEFLAVDGTEKASVYSRVAARLPGVFGRLCAAEDFDEWVQRDPYRADVPAPEPVRKWASDRSQAHGMTADAVHARAACAALRNVTPVFTKQAAATDDPEAEALARRYALYKLAAVHRWAGTPSAPRLLEMAVRQNFNQPLS